MKTTPTRKAATKKKAKTAAKPRAAKPRKPAARSTTRATPAAKSRPRANTSASPTPAAAAAQIDQRIRDLEGWRGDTLARMRALILKAVPGMTEEWKWNTPVWSHQGIVCTGEAYQKVVKLTFARGAAIPDPARLFNSSLGGNTRRAIDIREGEKVDAAAFQALVKAAVAANAGKKGR